MGYSPRHQGLECPYEVAMLAKEHRFVLSQVRSFVTEDQPWVQTPLVFSGTALGASWGCVSGTALGASVGCGGADNPLDWDGAWTLDAWAW